MKNRGLGRGLSSLLGEEVIVQTPESGDRVNSIEIRLIEAGKYQPRRNFAQEALQELSESIKRNGVMQPIIVHQTEGNKYAIIAGERRFRAAKLAGLDVIPAIIKESEPEKLLELALVENIQREDLNVMEEAEGYAQLIDEFGYTQEDVSKFIGKSRSHIANLLRLNNLPEMIKIYLSTEVLTMGHARPLVGHPMAEEIAGIIIDKGLNVRQTESLVKNWSDREKHRAGRIPQYNESQNDDLVQLVKILSAKFGMKISIESEGGGDGRIIFHFSSLEQLDSILTRLT